jgi:MoaA/NifB/PqqE/SkfB family radical SAM enzyme
MKSNIVELPVLIELAADCQARFVIVSHLLPHTDKMKKQILYEFNSDQAIEIFNRARAEAESRNLELKLYPEFVPHIYSLFGLPPLRGTLPSSPYVARDFSGEKEQVLQILERAVTTGLEHNVMLNFTKLIPAVDGKFDTTIQAFDQAQAKAEKCNIALDLPPLVPRTIRECGFIREGICFVSWDGYVRPCNNLNHSYLCYINDRPKNVTSVSFGNVLEQDLREIWNREDYSRFRELVHRFDFAPCGDCNFADGCYFINSEVFQRDCYNHTQPCGDCPWARGILKCL